METVEQLEPSAVPSEPETRSDSHQKPASPDEDLLSALRGFVRRVNDQPGSEATHQNPIGRFQAVVLLILVLDAVLLHSEFQHWFENSLIQFALKVAPWLLGATAFTYSEKVRTWILARCERVWVAVLAVAMLIPLVVPKLPLFSVRVRVASDSVSLTSEDNRIIAAQQDRRVFLVTLPDLAKPYKISVKDELNSNSIPFTLTLGRWRVAMSTLARIPLLGRLFGAPELILTPLYHVNTKSNQPGAYADIEGAFQEGFFQADSLTTIGCSPSTASRPGFRAVRCRLGLGWDALNLPSGGSYLITLFRGTCKKVLPPRSILEDANDPIDIDSLCSQ